MVPERDLPNPDLPVVLDPGRPATWSTYPETMRRALEKQKCGRVVRAWAHPAGQKAVRSRIRRSVRL
jgi:hypothetical protein